MLWFLTALKGKSLNVKIADLDQVTCAKPKHLKGKLVQDLKKKDVCGKGKYKQILSILLLNLFS